MNSYKILMIEDEENICNFMKMTFETNGYQILFANTGKNGMTMFSSHHPNLLILDLGLPVVYQEGCLICKTCGTSKCG